MHKSLCRRARKRNINLNLVTEPFEDAEIPTGSVDTVISSLVMCTVWNMDEVLEEIRRVLKPGGTFRFVEHVHAPEGTLTRKLQDWIHEPWRYLFDGCNTNRDIAAAINRAGFKETSIKSYYLKSPFLPVNYQIYGVCRVFQ